MNTPLYKVAKWAGAIATILTLGGWMSRSSVRIHKMEEETGKVTGIQRDVQVIKMTLKLIAPEKFKQAEELAK